MTHHIETHGNLAAAVFARQDAWHRLGTTVAGQAFTAEEAMRLGHLGGWNVRKVPLSANVLDEHGITTLDVPAFATVRTNPFTQRPEALGVVGSGPGTCPCRTRSTPSSSTCSPTSPGRSSTRPVRCAVGVRCSSPCGYRTPSSSAGRTAST